MSAASPVIAPAATRNPLADETLVAGGGGDSTVHGGAGDDLIYSAGSPVYLDGGRGDDSLLGGPGDDFLGDGDGNDWLDGGAGNDVLSVLGFGDITVRGGAGNDSISVVESGPYRRDQPDHGAVQVGGGAGDDRIDVYLSSAGNYAVTASGGAGADLYRLSLNNWSEAQTEPIGSFVITDFVGDRIDVSVLLDWADSRHGAWQGGNPFDPALGLLRLRASGADTALQFDADGSAGPLGWQTVVTFAGLTPASLHAANFVGGYAPDGSAPLALLRTGSGHADSLIGGGAADTLDGGRGDDSLAGGGGADLLLGGAGSGADSLRGEAGADTLDGGAGADTLDGGSGADWLRGGAGADSLSGGSGSDRLEGGSGSDRLDSAGGGSDSLLGGAGDDWLDLQAHDGARLVADGGAGADVLLLGIDDGSADGTLLARGGSGSDLFVPGRAGHCTVADFAAGAGGDRIDVRYLVGDAGASDGGNPFAAGIGLLRLLQHGNDCLLQWDEDGAAGSQFGWKTVLQLRGVDAADLTGANFVGAIAPDGSAAPVLDQTGAAGADSLRGGYAGDLLRGGAGNDSLDGDAGADRLEGGSGNDRLDGAAGADTLLGGAGADTLDGGSGSDRLDGGAGDDWLDSFASGDRDSLFGGSGQDRFRISADNGARVQASGGAGDDRFEVSLTGSAEAVLSGGAGADRFAPLGAGHTPMQLVIADFDPGRDRFDYTSLMASSAALGYYDGGDPLSPEQGFLRWVQRGTASVVQFDPDGAAGAGYGWIDCATLLGVAADELGVSDFELAPSLYW
ncbi:calcium-binding protein [Derxia lacustris]|uniref:calcium-binding protein n=1 Tax=Derxia lacustris TaxID=764842 RepID=UPI000A17311F|nr:calcium-binding protein [Derxia lacustris]